MKTLDTNIKALFELEIQKKLILDNFFPYLDKDPTEFSALELAERYLNIAMVQNYINFGTAYRSQLINAFGEVLGAYRDITGRIDRIREQYPEASFLPMDGYGQYRIYRDGSNGNILKVSTDARVGVGTFKGKPEYENIISASIYVLDKSNYNYRTVELDEWTPQSNLIVWKDLVQGNGFLNFILTLPRSAAIPMRVVTQASTRQMVRPIVPVPPPPPFYPPMPGPGPVPPGPGPVPPGPYPWPYPPPPPPPPMPHCRGLVRPVVAERTVGGINEGDILPEGLSFTQFVEWLLHGQQQIEQDPEGHLGLSGLTLTFNVTTVGTATPQLVKFYEVGNSTPIGEYQYIDTSVYTHELASPPAQTTKYYVELTYLRLDGSSDEFVSNEVTYTVTVNQLVYFGRVDYDTANMQPIPTTVEAVSQLPTIDLFGGINNKVELMMQMGGRRGDYAVAVPDALGEVKFYSDEDLQYGADSDPELTQHVVINNKDYTIYQWGERFVNEDLPLYMVKA